MIPLDARHAAHRHCVKHDLACGPDGMCALCRREAAAAPSKFGGRVIVVGAAALVLATVGAIGVKSVASVWRVAKARAEAAAARDAQGAPVEAVRLYTTSWCPHCARAKKWLTAQNVVFVELDVERDAWARREHRRLNPRGSVPTFDAAGEVVQGFSEEAYRTALQRAPPRSP
jgi:glutaredoxin 3